MSAHTAIALRLQGIHKAYGPVRANRDVSLQLKKGSIHGILGENGAGKSTAMKIIYGMEEADGGAMWVDEQAVQFRSPLEAKALGIGMVHQHFMLADEHTVLENIILGQEPSFAFDRLAPKGLQRIDYKQARLEIEALMQAHHLELPLDSKAGDLSLGARQRLELLKLLFGKARIFILDEPTAVLSPAEVKGLFTQLRELAKKGCSILIVTHKLKELMDLCDEISILRQGTVTGTFQTARTNPDELAAAMIGERYKPIKNQKPRKVDREPILSIQGLQLHRGPATREMRLDLQLAEGEILGLAGVDHNGQAELSEALRHPKEFLRQHACARLSFAGQDMRSWTTEEVMAAGIGHIPADRHREGLDLDKSASENFFLSHTRDRNFYFGPFIRWKKVREATEGAMKGCDVQPPLPDLKLHAFSGGNQQKLIFARETYRPLRLLIAMQVTRGVDIGAIQLLHRKLLELRDQGTAILLISSELDEILALSDRIAVLENYRIVSDKEAAAVDETYLGLAMSGSLHQANELSQKEPRA